MELPSPGQQTSLCPTCSEKGAHREAARMAMNWTCLPLVQRVRVKDVEGMDFCKACGSSAPLPSSLLVRRLRRAGRTCSEMSLLHGSPPSSSPFPNQALSRCLPCTNLPAPLASLQHVSKAGLQPFFLSSAPFTRPMLQPHPCSWPSQLQKTLVRSFQLYKGSIVGIPTLAVSSSNSEGFFCCLDITEAVLVLNARLSFWGVNITVNVIEKLANCCKPETQPPRRSNPFPPRADTPKSVTRRHRPRKSENV